MRISLRKMRQTQKFTQAKLAEMSNTSERNYRRIEAGKQTPNVYTAQRIAQALHTTVEEVFPLPQKNSSDTYTIKE